MPRQALTIDSCNLSSLALEEEIIQGLRNQAKDATDSTPLYEDPDFAPHVSSLYFDANHLPDYASQHGHEVYWYRPTEYAPDPDYFKTSSGCGLVREGILNDAWLLGVFAAVALHPDNLIENLFVSESVTHFKHYGVYTCRFFKDNEWISVTTDTRIPYSIKLEPHDKSFNATSCRARGAVLYGSSNDPNEVFLPLLEKAYAKLHGTYQILDEKYGGGMGSSAGTSSGRILEAFLDCTGGSAHRVDLRSELLQAPAGPTTSASIILWHQLLQYQNDHCIVTMQLRQVTSKAHDVTQLGILTDRQYIVQYVTEVKEGTGPDGVSPSCLRLVKLQTVWARGMWQGAWSSDDSQWDDHPHVAHALRSNPRCAFSRAGTDGCFWMAWEDVLETFTELYVVHVFHPDVHHQYSVRGDWVGPSAAGGPVKRPQPVVPVEPKPGATTRARETSIDKTQWTWRHDADPNWHRNPQYTLSVPLERHQEDFKRDQKLRNICVSLTQRDFRLYGGDNYAINFVLLDTQQRVATHEEPSPLWEFKRSHVVAEAHSSDADATMGTVPTGLGTASTSTLPMKALPERELVHKAVTLSSGTLYYLVPYTTSPMVEMEFFLRVVASHPLRLERVPPILSVIRTGEWRADDKGSAHRILTPSASAGGPLLSVPLPQAHVAGNENAAWCQNPQFWVRFADRSPCELATLRTLVATKAHVTLKLVLRKTFPRTFMSKSRQREMANKECAHTIGITALRTTSIGSVMNGAGKAAATHCRTHGTSLKTNFLGEPIASPKAGTTAVRTNLGHGTKSRYNHLDKEVARDDLSDDQDRAATASNVLLRPFPTPKLVVNPTEWCRLSSYTSPVVACLYLRKVPKEWLFALDSANAIGGLLIVPTMSEVGVPGSFELQVDSDFPLLVDELPRGTRAVQSLPGEWTETHSGGCHLHAKWRQNPIFNLEIQGTQPTKVRITLTRSEREWKPQCQRDPVGTMIGFYVFPKGSGKFYGPEQKSVPLATLKVNGRAWTATDFVPLHTITSPPDLVLSPALKNGYVIIPTTHEPGKVGKFVLSVECTTDFTLCRDVA